MNIIELLTIISVLVAVFGVSLSTKITFERILALSKECEIENIPNVITRFFIMIYLFEIVPIICIILAFKKLPNIQTFSNFSFGLCIVVFILGVLFVLKEKSKIIQKNKVEGFFEAAVFKITSLSFSLMCTFPIISMVIYFSIK